MDYNDYNYCPLTEKDESIVDCMENVDIAERFIPERFKQKPDWLQICRNCPIHKELFDESTN